jgi:hypothetical protein
MSGSRTFKFLEVYNQKMKSDAAGRKATAEIYSGTGKI